MSGGLSMPSAATVRCALEKMKGSRAYFVESDFIGRAPEGHEAARRDIMEKLARCIAAFEAWLEELE